MWLDHFMSNYDDFKGWKLHYLSQQSVPWLATPSGEEACLYSQSEPFLFVPVSIFFYEKHESSFLLTHHRYWELLLSPLKSSCSWLMKPSFPSFSHRKIIPTPAILVTSSGLPPVYQCFPYTGDQKLGVVSSCGLTCQVKVSLLHRRLGVWFQ